MRHSKKQIENSLHRAVNAQTPDVLPRVLGQIRQKEGRNITMETSVLAGAPAAGHLTAEKPNRKKSRMLYWAAAAAAVLALAIGSWFGIAFYKTDAVVSFDVNPSIELRLNSNRRVLSATALNADAETILGEMDLKNVDLEVAVNALIGSMLKNGYISSDKNTVLISVEGTNAQRRDALQQQLAQAVDGILAASSIDAAVLSQSLGDDTRLQELARQYGISLGKAALVDLLVSQDPLLNFEELAALPVNDLCLLLSAKQAQPQGIDTKGQPSSGAYIGEAAAKKAALDHAGVAEQDLLSYKIELDFDDGRMVYEVEFNTAGAEYEYEIDATTGAVLSYERDDDHRGGHSGTPSGFIGEEAAKAIALADAGLQQQNVNFVKFTWYEKQGVYLYDMIFLTDTHKYTYHINAVTGDILASYVHNRSSSDDGKGGNQGENQGSYISQEQAKAIAFGHAGVAEASVQRLEIKLKEDDGRMVYEIEFVHGYVEYDYEIDAITGEIIEWEADRD